MLSERACPGCQESFEPEVWQEDDGPCIDGDYYCEGCLMTDLCGCSPGLPHTYVFDSVPVDEVE